MLRVRTGVVRAVCEEWQGVQWLEVQLSETGGVHPAVHYYGKQDNCRPGDTVLLNTTAVDLGLGTGGLHFVVARLDERGERDLHPAGWGHVVKMRYTPLQTAVPCVEDPDSPWHELFRDETLSLEQTPVLLGELHSMLPMLAIALGQLAPEVRVVYVMSDSAALPAVFSRHVMHTRRQGLVQSTVTAGQAWGGDLESVNLYTGLLAARHVAQADVIICLPGPGVAGTGTPLGFSGVDLAGEIHAVTALDGLPIVVPRISFMDRRDRHVGISHHTRTVLGRLVFRPALVPVPLFGDERDLVIRRQLQDGRLADRHHLLYGEAPAVDVLTRWTSAYPEPLATMGRGMSDDPAPFQAAAVAAEIAWFAWRKITRNGSASSPVPHVTATLAASWNCRPSAEG